MADGLIVERLTELYDFFVNAPVGYQILGPDGKVIIANHAALGSLGYDDEPDKYIGRPFDSVHHADGSDGWMGAVLSGAPVAGLPVTAKRSDRSRTDLVLYANSGPANGASARIRCVTVPADGPLAAQSKLPSRPVAPDIEKLGDTERADLLELLEDAFENAPVGLHIVGPDGLVKRTNRIELETLGYADAPQGYVGHHIAEFHLEQAVIDEMLESLVSGRPLVRYPATLKRSDGTPKSVLIYSTPRFEGGDFVSTRCFTLPDTGQETRSASFAWPRNDEAEEEGGSSNPLTAALRRLAGRKQAEASLGFLAETSKALLRESGTAAAQALCDLSVPFLADWCAVQRGDSEADMILFVSRGGGLTGSDALILQAAAAGVGRPGVPHVASVELTAGDAGKARLLAARGQERPAFGAADIAMLEELGRRMALAMRA